MLACVAVSLPFNMVVPEGGQFNLRAYEDDDCEVTVYPPRRTDVPISASVPTSILLNGGPAFTGNGLQIDFRKPSFIRDQNGPLDPSEEQIMRAIRSFLNRLRAVSNGHQVRIGSAQDVMWRVRYLNDDETELDDEPGKFRGLGRLSFNWSLVAVNAGVWENIHSLDPDFEPEPWETLRLDAFAALPHVGTALVLGATSLEVFIAATLDKMAKRTAFPPGLWPWLTDRGNHLRDPAVDEQFDALLKSLCGHSLKEQPALWEAFCNLKTARNKFVHEGRPHVGKAPVTTEQALALIRNASAIIDWVEQWLPEEEQRPKFAPSASFEIQHDVFGRSPTEAGAAQQAVEADGRAAS